MISREFHWSIAGHDITVRVEESQGHGTFHVEGRSLPFRLLQSNWIEIEGKKHRFHVVRSGNEYTIWFNGHTYHFARTQNAGLGQAAGVAASGEVLALMPGKVLRVEVEVGDTVEEKQTVVLMESMKMESALRAPRAGRVARICCQVGQIVEMGQLLVVID